MVCPYCHEKLVVANSRPQQTTNSVWRRRACPGCDAVFTSIEAINLGSSIRVKHPNGLEPFMKEKLLMSVYESLQHRKQPLSEARDLTETMCAQLMRHHLEKATIHRGKLVDVVGSTLKRFDTLAGMHYQARFDE